MSVFALTERQLHERFAEIPVLAREPREIEDLSGGLTNRNVKVTTPDGVYVVRVSEDNAEDLDIDREAEAANSRAAAEAGVGAPVFASRPDLGLLVIVFLDGVTLINEAFRDDGFATRAAQAIRQLHEGPRFVNDFDMFKRQPRYRRRCEDQGFRIVDGEKVWLIDYDYSGNNDACFELGNSWAECRLDDEHLEEIVTAYFGASRPEKVARARLQAVVSQYGWSLWGFIQNAVSPLDYDFWHWAMEHYEWAVAEMERPGFRQLLEDATHDG